jgi:multiple sugar transport system substrate-binding protein
MGAGVSLRLIGYCVALAVLVILTVLGCAPGASPIALAPTPVPATVAPTSPPQGLSGKLRVATWQEAPQEKFYQETFERFMQLHPNVEIEYIVAPTGEYADKLNVMLAAGDPADVFLSGIGFPYTYEGVATNTYADLTARYESELKGQLLESAVTTWTVDGKLYGLPVNVAALGNLCYNKKAFDEAGVAYPTDDWTGVEFRAAAQKLVKRDAAGSVTQWGALPWPDFFYISVPGILNSNGGGAFSPDGKQWVAGIEPYLSANVAALEPYVAMAAEDKSVPTPGETREMGFGEGMFERGELAMRHCGFFHLPIYNQVAGLDYGVALNDSWRVKPYVGISPLALVISAQSENPDAAWEFIKFVTSPEIQTLQFRETGNLPANIEVLNSQELVQDPVFARIDLAGWIRAAMERGEALPGPHDTPVAPFAISEVWERFMEPAWKGEITVREALTRMQPEMEKLFAQ